MGYQAAGWLDRPEREKEEDPAKLLAALDLKPGMVVADVGAGTGYHSFRMAKVVGDTGKVLAVDVQPEMLKLVEARAKRDKVANVQAVPGEEADPKLPRRSVDLVLMVDVYHEFRRPYEMGDKLVAALKPGGRLAFVEYRAEDPAVPIKAVHKMSERQVIREMAEFPAVRHTRTVGTLPWQHVCPRPRGSTSAAGSAVLQEEPPLVRSKFPPAGGSSSPPCCSSAPLFWIGLLMKEEYRVCGDCGSTLSA